LRARRPAALAHPSARVEEAGDRVCRDGAALERLAERRLTLRIEQGSPMTLSGTCWISGR
jgi:hypothetical protein